MFVLENPPTVERWIGEDKLPLLSTTQCLLPIELKPGVVLPDRAPMPESDRQHAFHFVGAQVHVYAFDVFNATCCSGNYCDLMEVLDTNGKMIKRCSCWQPCHEAESVGGSFKLKICYGQMALWIPNFTSKSFVAECTKQGRFSTGITAEFANRSRSNRTAFRNSVIECVNYINGHGGFDVVGWAYRGLVKDAALSEERKSVHEKQSQVKSGELTYHLSSIQPSREGVKGSPELYELKFDLDSLAASTPAGIPSLGRHGNRGRRAARGTASASAVVDATASSAAAARSTGGGTDATTTMEESESVVKAKRSSSTMVDRSGVSNMTDDYEEEHMHRRSKKTNVRTSFAGSNETNALSLLPQKRKTVESPFHGKKKTKKRKNSGAHGGNTASV